MGCTKILNLNIILSSFLTLFQIIHHTDSHRKTKKQSLSNHTQEQVVTAHQGPIGPVGLFLLGQPELPNMLVALVE